MGGHLEREKKRLKELHDYLSQHMDEFKLNYPTLVTNVTSVEGVKDYDASQLELFKKIADILVLYRQKLHPWREMLKKRPKKLQKIQDIETEISHLITLYETHGLKQLIVGAEESLSPKERIFSYDLTSNEPVSENSESEQLKQVKQVKEEKATIAAKFKNNFLVKLAGNSLFKLWFAWSWAYWFVFFFTCWGNPFTVAFKAVPLEWGLLTLVGPIFYLVYKEYVTYRSQLVADETQLTKEQQDELSRIEDKNEKVKRHTEMLKANEKEAVQFRWGWILVALVTGISISLLSGFTPFYAALVGIGIFTGVMLASIAISNIIDKKLKFARNALKEQAKELCGRCELHAFEETKIENFDLAARKITGKAIILVGDGTNGYKLTLRLDSLSHEDEEIERDTVYVYPESDTNNYEALHWIATNAGGEIVEGKITKEMLSQKHFDKLVKGCRRSTQNNAASR